MLNISPFNILHSAFCIHLNPANRLHGIDELPSLNSIHQQRAIFSLA